MVSKASKLDYQIYPCHDQEDPLLTLEEHAAYRRHVGRLLYLSADRIDLAFTVKSLSQALASPRQSDLTALKRLLRYCIGRTHMTYVIDCKFLPKNITVYSDSDWASDKATRRSTSGVVLCLGSSIIQHISRTQSVVALSSCEAELNAAVVAICESLFLQTVMRELGSELKIQLFVDSQATLQHLFKLGMARLKHVHIRTCFLQQLLEEKTLPYIRLPGN